MLPQLSDFSPTLQSTYGKTKGDKQYFICIPRIKMADFLSFIGECPFDEYLYKWNLKEYKNKVSKPQLENEKYFIKLYLLGLGCKQIAEVFEVDFNTVKKYLKKIIYIAKNILVFKNEDREYIDRLVYVGE